MIWGYLFASFWQKEGGGYSSWPFCRRCTGWGMPQSPQQNCRESAVVASKTSLRPCLSGWQERWGKWLDHCESRSPSCPESGRCVLDYLLQSSSRMSEWNFFRELVLLDLFGERKLVDLHGWSRVIQQSGLPDPLLDQFIESEKVGRPTVLKVGFRLHWVVLEATIWARSCWLSNLNFSCF